MATHILKGNGDPITLGVTPPEIGMHFVNEASDPKEHWLSVGDQSPNDWIKVPEEGGGASTFTDLTDTPSSYDSGDAGKIVRVNSTEDGLEFVVPGGGNLPVGGDTDDILTKNSNADGDASFKPLTDQPSFTSLESRVSTNETDIQDLEGDVNALDSRVSTNETNIGLNQSDIATNKTDITDLQTDKEEKAAKGQPSGYAPLDANSTVPDSNLSDNVQLKTDKGAAAGYAPLDAGARVPKVNLPTDTVYQGDNNLGGLTDVDLAGLEDRQSIAFDNSDSTWKSDHRVKWRGTWVEGTYKTQEMVVDGEWTMIANKETSDRAGVEQDGEPQYTIPDSPSWNPQTDTPLSSTGALVTLSDFVVIDQIRFWRPSDSADFNYILIGKNVTDPNNPEVILNEEVPAGPIGWVEFQTEGRIWEPGTEFELELVTGNTGSDDTWSRQWLYVAATSGDPGSRNWRQDGGANQNIAISKTDWGLADATSDLSQLKTGDKLLTSEAAAQDRFVEYVITDINEQPSYFEFLVDILEEGNTIRTNQLCNVEAFIRVAGNSPLVELPNYYQGNDSFWSDSATFQGFRRSQLDDPIVGTDTAYGVDLRGVRLTKSDDWDIVAVSSTTVTGGGGDGGAERFTELVDTPSSYVSEGGKFLKVADNEGGIIFSEESETTPQNQSVYVDTSNGDDTLDEFRGNIERPFKTIKAAADYVTTQSPGNGNDWSIRIQPGVYIEQPIVLPQNTALNGIDPFKTNIFPADETGPLITLQIFDNLQNLNIDGRLIAGSGLPTTQPAISIPFVAGNTMNSILINNFDTGITITGGAGTDVDMVMNNVSVGQLGTVTRPIVVNASVGLTAIGLIAQSPADVVLDLSNGVDFTIDTGFIGDATSVISLTDSNLKMSTIFFDRCKNFATLNGNSIMIGDGLIGQGDGTDQAVLATGIGNRIQVSDSSLTGFTDILDISSDCQLWLSDCVLNTGGAGSEGIIARDNALVTIRGCTFFSQSTDNTLAIDVGTGADFPNVDITASSFQDYAISINTSSGQTSVKSSIFRVLGDLKQTALSETIGINVAGTSDTSVNDTILIVGNGAVVGGNGIARLSSVRFFLNNNDFEQKENGTIEVSQCYFDEDRVVAENWDNVEGNYQSEKLGDKGLISLGKLKVGVPEVGRSSALGEGSSYTRGMLVYEFDADTLTFTDVSEDARSLEGSTPVGIPNTSPNSAIYIGSSLVDADLDPVLFYGLSLNYSQLQEEGEGDLVLEYFNGSTWVKINSMTTEGVAPYNIVSADIINTDTAYNVRMQDTLAKDWALSDPMSLGTQYYWIRLRVGTEWISSEWKNRLPITIPAAQVTGSHENFPVYLDLSLITDNTFWDNVQASGADIRVGSEDAFIAQELVWLNTTARTGELYFSATTLDSAVDNEFFIYFNNPSAQPVADDATNGKFNVWLDYIAVYHLQTNAYLDSTSNALHGTESGTINTNAVGKFGSDISTTNNNNDAVLLPNSSLLQSPQGNYQWECWVTCSTSDKRMACGVSNGSTNDLFTINCNNGRAYFDYRGSSRNSNVQIDDGNYHFLVQRQDRITTRRVQAFVDAVLTNDNAGRQSLGSPSVPPAIANTGATTSKRWGGGDQIDEVRVTDTIKSDSWLQTQYDNGNDTANFFTFGTVQNEAEAPGNPIDVVPEWNQIKLWPSCTYFNIDGFQEFYGNARPVVRGVSSTTSFKDTAGSQTAQDGDQVWLSKEFGITAPFRMGPDVVRQITDVSIFGALADLSSNARIRIHFIARNDSSGGGDVLFKIVGATSDANTIFETTEGNAPDSVDTSVTFLRVHTVPSDGNNKDQFVNFELNFPTRDFQEQFTQRTNLLWVTIERQGTSGLDTFAGDVDIVSIASYFTTWRIGEHITFF